MKNKLTLNPERPNAASAKVAIVFWGAAILATSAWTFGLVSKETTNLKLVNQELIAKEIELERFKSVQTDLESTKTLLKNYDAILDASELAIDQRPILTLLDTLGNASVSAESPVCITSLQLERKTHPTIKTLNMGYRLSLVGKSTTRDGVHDFATRLQSTQRFNMVNVESTSIENNNGSPFASFHMQCKY